MQNYYEGQVSIIGDITEDQANQVMGERFFTEEDYGFDYDLDYSAVSFENGEYVSDVIVYYEGLSQEQAEQVFDERTCYDEDYGFDYTIYRGEVTKSSN